MHAYTHLFRQCTVRGFAITAVLALAGPLLAQVDIGLTPMRVEFPAVGGKPYSGSLVLKNGGTVKSRVRAELLDFYMDENTTPQFVANAPAEAGFSCRSWLSVNPMELEVGPQSQVLVRYSVRVPVDATERSYHCALGFLTLPAALEASGTAMRTAVRMVAAFYPIVGKPPITGVIKDLKLEPVSNPSGTIWRAVVVMENSGLMLYRPAGSVDVVDSSGKVVESQKLPSFPALPRRQQRYVLALKTGLPPDQYTLRARIEVGGEIQQGSVVVKAEAPDPPATAEVPAIREAPAK